MSGLWPLIFVVSGLALGGVLISLAALLAPIRLLAQRSTGARVATISILGLISLAVGFGLWTRLSAEAVYTFGTMAIADTFDPRSSTVTWPYEESKPAIVNELWVRLLVPPPLRQTCTTDHQDVCSLVNGLPSSSGVDLTWRGYLRDISIGLLSLLACVGMTWRFTARRGDLLPAT